MSTAISQSAFYDVGEVLCQDRTKSLSFNRNLHNQGTETRRILGMGTNANLFSPVPRSCSQQVQQVQQQQQQQVQQQQRSLVADLYDFHHQFVLRRDSSSPPLIQQQTRRLDRSMSEPIPAQQQQQQQQRQNVNASRYKTELCRPFEENGHCKYGDKCQFAHGEPELRSLSRHPKYKTEPCRTFHTIGFCPYGPRCHFVHNEDLRRYEMSQQMRAQQSPSSAGSCPQHMGMSGPTPITRPKALSFSYSMPYAITRESLGSTADSPPSSISDSPPTLSPTLEDSMFYHALPSAFSPPPPMSARTMSSGNTNISSSAFPFSPVPEDAPMAPQNLLVSAMTPLNVQTADLVAGLTNLNLRGCEDYSSTTYSMLRDSSDHMYAPPSPPESDSSCDSGVSIGSATCESPLDVSRGLPRLPIFSRLSRD